jgi:aspartyl-tRNA(Asn)/glutamyl-tRNA(Gln) amidotransferase subunit A
MLRALEANGSQFAAEELNAIVGDVAVGVAREGFFDGLDADVARCVEAALDVIRSLVRSVGDVKLELGVKGTSFDAEILEYHHKMLADTPQLYQPGTLERLRACGAIPRAEFAHAVSELATARRRAEELFATVDVVVTPTVLVAAPTITDLNAMTSVDLRAFEVQKLLHNTAPFSLLFWPSVSVPCGFTGNGLPVGLQISSRPGGDDLALRVARAYQQATDWHKRVPAIAA